jgi:hypothetical protein
VVIDRELRNHGGANLKEGLNLGRFVDRTHHIGQIVAKCRAFTRSGDTRLVSDETGLVRGRRERRSRVRHDKRKNKIEQIQIGCKSE